MKRLLIQVAVLLLCGMAAAATTLVLLGRTETLIPSPLLARVQLNQVSVPSSYEIDPLIIADQLVTRMQSRAQTDTALRLMLGQKTNELLRDRAIPRLVNAGVIRRMLEEMVGLGSVIEYATYRSMADITVANRGAVALADVAITLPGAVRVEAVGAPTALVLRNAGVPSISLGAFAEGQSRSFRVWSVAAPAEIVKMRSKVLVGAEKGLRGRVLLSSPVSGWNGGDLQDVAWARWLATAIPALLAFAALAAIALTIAAGLRRSRPSRA